MIYLLPYDSVLQPMYSYYTYNYKDNYKDIIKVKKQWNKKLFMMLLEKQEATDFRESEVISVKVHYKMCAN